MPIAPYIAFEGLIGAGKTSLATQLATHIDADLHLEAFVDNSFLADYYVDNDRWGLPMQLWFLIARHEAAIQLQAPTTKPLVSDYSPLKEPTLARNLLRLEREYALYRRISRALLSKVRSPDVIVYLDAPNEILLKRIQSRNRLNENQIDDAFLSRLKDAYATTLDECSSPIIRLDTSAIRPDDPVETQRLWQLISSLLEPKA